MFVYEKKLQYPIKIKNTNPKLAAAIISQYGGPYINKLQNSEVAPVGTASLFHIISHSHGLRKNGFPPEAAAALKNGFPPEGAAARKNGLPPPEETPARGVLPLPCCCRCR